MSVISDEAREQLAENVEVICETCGARRMVETTDSPPAACADGSECKEPFRVIAINP